MTGHLPEMALVINRGLFMLLKSHYSMMNSVCIWYRCLGR